MVLSTMPNTNCKGMAALRYINNVNLEECDSINASTEHTCGDDCFGRAYTYTQKTATLVLLSAFLSS